MPPNCFTLHLWPPTFCVFLLKCYLFWPIPSLLEFSFVARYQGSLCNVVGVISWYPHYVRFGFCLFCLPNIFETCKASSEVLLHGGARGKHYFGYVWMCWNGPESWLGSQLANACRFLGFRSCCVPSGNSTSIVRAEQHTRYTRASVETPFTKLV